MTRDVDLVHYLPLYLRDFSELTATLEAEDPEFVLVWNASDRALNNMFILTADEYGISRYEQLLGLTAYEDDDLETRREIVLSAWVSSLPYTIRMLAEKLGQICGDYVFSIEHDFDVGYSLTITTNLESAGKLAEVESLLAAMVPANIVYSVDNSTPNQLRGTLYIGGAVEIMNGFELSDSSEETVTLSGQARHGGSVMELTRVELSMED
ncbi:MAG: YmfQ family protein [Bacteroidales bacterium]|nr:YmfQ family protein [Bacteroidales bacterium]